MAGAFSRKASGISCDLTAFRKIKEHRAKAVETPLGVTGLLRVSTIYVLSKNKKNITIFHLTIIIFTAVKNHSILHGHS